MYYVYVLKSLKENTTYIGVTSNLKKRFVDHNSGRSTYTKSKRPWKLLYYEAYFQKSTAYKREYRLKKYGKEKQSLFERINI